MEKMTLKALTLLSALLLVTVGAVSSLASVWLIYQPKTPKCLR